MLQQTTVAAVIPYYERWLRLFPDVAVLARAPLQKVLKAWEGLGYYERARRLHRAARIVCRDWAGSLPQAESDLRRIPGFGPYIAAAVLSLAFGQPVAVLDANVRRVISRLKRITGGAGARSDRVLRGYLDELLDRDRAAAFNQAVMELGALVCRPRRPLCPRCPVRRYCLAFRAGEQESIPRPKKRPAAKIETVVAVIEENGRFLIQRRPPSGLMAGLWEFPGGKREKGESLEGALRRELGEELGASVETARLLLKVRHAYTRFQVTLYAYETILKNVPALDRRTHRWVSRRGLDGYPFPSGNARIIGFLKSRKSDHQHGHNV
jgi:A/G-specific adenine glycosylase